MQLQNLSKKAILCHAVAVLLLVAIALVCIVPIRQHVTAPETYAHSIKSIDDKKAAVMGLSAAAAAAATAVAAIPGDATTPIAEQIMETSSYLLLVVCVLVLEKSLITVIGGAAFGLLLPAACGLLCVWLFFRKDWLFRIALKLAAFALLVALIIPVSVRVSDLVYEINQSTVEQIMEDAAESDADNAAVKQETWWETATEKLKNGAADVKDGAQKILNKFIDAIAIFIITYCAVPVLVLLAMLWLVKIFFGLSIPVPKNLPKLHKKTQTHAETPNDFFAQV